MATDPQIVKKRHAWFVAVAAVLIVAAVAGYIAYDMWHINQKTQAILGAPGVITVADNDNPEKAAEGSEATTVTPQDFSTYKVAADLPKLITVDSLGLTARIRSLGLNSDKSIQAPKNIYDAGWYTGSAKPGESGAMFIDGHASGATRYGLFANLDRMKAGDIVGVEKGDGEKLKYKVVQVSIIPLNAINMGEILATHPGVKEGLNLMTCTGKWVDDTATLDHRVVVYTERI